MYEAEIQTFLIHYCDGLYHACTFERYISTHNSSLEGAMKLKLGPFYSS